MSFAVRLTDVAHAQIRDLPKPVGWYVCARLFDLAEDPVALGQPPVGPYLRGMAYQFSAGEVHGAFFLIRFQFESSEEAIEVFFVQSTPLRQG